MIPRAILDEVFTCLAGVDGLNVPELGTQKFGPPGPVTTLPEVSYGADGAGLDRIRDLAVTVFVGPAANPEITRRALDYVATDGAKSVWLAVMSYAWTTCDTVYITSAEPVIDNLAGADLLGYTFHIDITCSRGR